MTSFYETTEENFNKAIPALLFKIFETTGKPIFFLTENATETKNFDNFLWSFSSNKFLPHGTLNDSEEHYAPLLVSEILENNNAAEILVSTRPIPSDFANNFKKTIFVYHSNSENKKYYEDLFSEAKNTQGTKFWKQEANGKWNVIFKS